MAGHVRYTALLDSCVLYPTTTADALMSLSVAGLFAAKWSQTIEVEFIACVERSRPELTGKPYRRRDHMRLAIPDREVAPEAYEALVPCLSLPDSSDVHVLAAAIAGHADCIVTANLTDFPDAIVGVHGIEVIHPDDFIVMQLDIDPVIGLSALKAMRARMKNPPRSPEEFAQLLERCQLFSTAQRIREAAALI
jgi:predicted nucleic acid-binding protein